MQDDVRRIRADEWREYRELRLEALKDSPLAFVEQYETSVRQPDQFWQERVRRAATDRTVAGFVSVNAGRFLGKASCIIEPEVTDHVSAHIVGVYVQPGARGREKGTAGRLIAAAVDWAHREAGAQRVRLFVLDANERAQRFYRRAGFVATGHTMPYPPDPSYVELEMVYRATGTPDDLG
jgi:RimJ/RimL family protein N-acetyltransferase